MKRTLRRDVVRATWAVGVLVVFLASAVGAAGQSLDVPPEKIPGDKPGTMMHRYWLRQAEQAFQRWQADYEARKTPEQIADYQKRLREKFLEAIGGLPERTPLGPKVTGTVAREGFRVEKIIFESQPKHFVTALLFLPEAKRFKPPYPGVLVPCGHARSAKGHGEYQSMGALLALNGMAALVFDPIDQGERGQYLGKDGWPKLWGTGAHSLVGIGSTLLGRNTAWFEIWDAMRAIDYLQSRPEVDPKQIGCTGNSGGGTQTSYTMALDDRIRAAAPSCYLCGFPALLRTIGPQDAEQNIFGQLAFGMDHADYVTMRAPTPILICAATKDFFDIGGAWETFRCAKRLFTRLGYAERVGLLENDAGHNYNAAQREGVARWMSRWLRGKDEPITEPPIQLLSEKELQCTPEGQVMLLPGARSVYDLNEEYENQLAPRRAALWKTGDRAELLAKVRQLAGIRRLQELPKPEVERLGAVERPGYRIEKLLLKPEEGIVLPALQFIPEKPKPNQAVLYVHEQGKAADAAPGGPIERLVQEGSTVLAVDLRGTGQTKPASEGKDVYTAYLLGRSYVGLRAEDILIAARYLKGQTPAGQPAAVQLVAVGHVGIPALHAAAVEPELFQAVKLVRTLGSWSGVIHSRLTQVQAAQIVHGALQTYDLPDLAATLGKKLTVEQPAELRVATFCCDVTPPLGQPMIALDALRTVEQPLLAKGIVLEAGRDRYVLCAVDWCELSNGAHQSLRSKIASAAGIDAARVAVQCVHQHTAPVVDLDAQKLLAEIGAAQLHLDLKAWDEITERLAAAVKKSLDAFEAVDHVGTGQAKVERVAATRRVAVEGGKMRVRYSTCKDADLRAMPEGTIDPYLKTITLARGQKPLVRLHYYATHPQSSYGDGRASSDFVGTVREKLQNKEKVFQVYFTGCGGDITVGKYNDGSRECRDALTERLLAGMEAAIAATKLTPAGPVRWRTCPLRLTPRNDAGHTLADCLARMKDPKTAAPSRVYSGAARAAFHQRSEQPIELSALEIGNVYIVHLPGEPMVEFQRFTQGLKPGAFVAVAGYGDCATGYLCTEAAFGEGGYEPTASAVAPESEAVLKKAIAALLGTK